MPAVRIQVWDRGDPPAGYELGEPPTDFGVGRAAYKWRDARPGDQPILVKGARILDSVLYRGDALLTHADGRTERISDGRKFNAEEVIGLLREAVANGLEVL
jgi:hypothetical protein